MKRWIAMTMALAFSAAIGAQTPAPAPLTPEEAAAKKAADRKAKQQMVQGTTESGHRAVLVDPVQRDGGAFEEEGQGDRRATQRANARREQPGDEPVRTGRRHRCDQGRQECRQGDQARHDGPHDPESDAEPEGQLAPFAAARSRRRPRPFHGVMPGARGAPHNPRAHEHDGCLRRRRERPPTGFARLCVERLRADVRADDLRFADRQVVVSMFPHLKAHWGLSDGQLGGLVSIVSIVVALGSVPLSLLADRWSRVKCMFAMAMVWSLATIGCAFAQSYGQLLFMRGVIGLGEAGYGAAGAALLASLFPGRLRSTVLGVCPRRRALRLGARRRARRRDRRALGLASRFRRGRCARPGACIRLPGGRARLQDRCTAERGIRQEQLRGGSFAPRDLRRGVAAADGAHRVPGRRTAARHGVGDLRVAAELLQSLLRIRARQGGPRRRRGRARQRVRGDRVEHCSPTGSRGGARAPDCWCRSSLP